MNMKFHHSMLISIIFLLTVGCAAFAKPAPTSLPPAVTETPLAETATPTIIPSPVPPTATVPAAIQASVKPDGLNMREGPSPLHPIVATFKKGDLLTITARARGSQWVKVQSNAGKTGWMYTPHLSFTVDINSAPIEEIEDSFNVKGMIADGSGQPIEGVSIALLPLSGNQAYRIDTVSGPDGQFYAYVPVNSYTSWRVSITGVRCGSRIADANCSISNYFAIKENTDIVLPQLDPLEFVYQQATSSITGIVRDWQGTPAADIRVFAVRTNDGARAWGSSQENGLFTLPAGDGVWEVYAALLNPAVDGKRVTVQITAGQPPEPVELVRP
jgi:uncharacterized protein YgiM (DUF1202 family)